MSLASTRQAIRNQRRILSSYQQKHAANAVMTHLCHLPAFIFARRIAFYLANDGEIDVSQTMAIAEAAGKQCYLPVLHPLKHNRLHFMQYRSGDKLVSNRYAIPEPKLNSRKQGAAWTMDLILLPLVGFDDECHRIGMGGGFYDRSLAFKQHSPRKSPLLMGVAHHFQQLDKINPNPWDISLDLVITDQKIFYSKHRVSGR